MDLIITEAERLAFSLDEIAERTSLSRSFLKKEIRNGNLRIKHFGRRVVVLSDDLRHCLQGGVNDKQLAP